MVMECESDDLSEAQINRIQSLQSAFGTVRDMIGQTDQQLPMMTVPKFSTNSSPSMSNGSSGIAVSLTGGNFALLQPSLTAQLLFLNKEVTPITKTVNVEPKSKNEGNTAPNLHAALQANSTIKPKTVEMVVNESGPKKRANALAASETSIVKKAKFVFPRSEICGDDDNDIEVLQEIYSESAIGNTANAKKEVPIFIFPHPFNADSVTIASKLRKELDSKVKSVLLKTSQEFVEWLLSEGLIRSSQTCSVHKIPPRKLKLGMFSDPKVLSTSGGYVWISECCGKKYVSVFSGSIFGSTPIDKVPPVSVLKLVYHWACQTSLANVEAWVKVSSAYIHKMYVYLKAVCTVILHDKVTDFGASGSQVELGIVSLGTSAPNGGRKSVKVEILGLFDCRSKSYRLFASEPEQGASARQRFMRILSPITNVVSTDATILCDESLETSCLYHLGYKKIIVCDPITTNIRPPSGNSNLMSYLRKHVPKIFQNSLSQLSLNQIQLCLDELSWRERFGTSAAHAHNTVLEHITYITTKELQTLGVLNILDKVIGNPLLNWKYKETSLQRSPYSLQPSIIEVPVGIPIAGGQIVNGVTVNNSSSRTLKNSARGSPSKTEQVPMLKFPQSVSIMKKNMPSMPPKPLLQQSVPPPKLVSIQPSVELSMWYYGTLRGFMPMKEVNSKVSFNCHICTYSIDDNLAFYSHIKWHVRDDPAAFEYSCNYCMKTFPTAELLLSHKKLHHETVDDLVTCRICEKVTGGSKQDLIEHMAANHVQSELPYECRICHFRSSFYFMVVSHFDKRHQGTPHVQCHYCLKVFTNNENLPAVIFSTRVYNHLQSHRLCIGKCHYCTLKFSRRADLLKHQDLDHTSRASSAGLKIHVLGVGCPVIMIRPVNTTVQRSVKAANPADLISISYVVNNYLNIRLDLQTGKSDVLTCLECTLPMLSKHHYRALQKCYKCNFMTCCATAMLLHARQFHHVGKRKRSYLSGPAILLPRELFCICGFSTGSGNHLALHLATCDGGRLSCYPSMNSAGMSSVKKEDDDFHVMNDVGDLLAVELQEG